MKKTLPLLLFAALLLFSLPANAAPPPPPPHGASIHAGHHMGPPPRHMHNHIHGGVSFNMMPRQGYWNGSRYCGSSIGCGTCYCPHYGVCRPFRHPGPQYSTGFYITFQ